MSSPDEQKRSVVLLLVATVITLSVVIAGAALVFSNRQDAAMSDGSSAPTTARPALGILDQFLSEPVTVEHKLYSAVRGETHTYGQGYLDLRDGCSFEMNLTGVLYSVDLISDGTDVWQRSTKRETGSAGNWELAMPLTSNVNSPLLGLTGNAMTMYCQLRNLSRALVDNSAGGYAVDRPALQRMLAQVRSKELAAMYRLAGVADEDAAQVAPGDVDVTPMLSALDRVIIEQPSADYLRIIFVGTGNVVLDEITLNRTVDRAVVVPGSVEPRGDRQQDARLFLGFDS